MGQLATFGIEIETDDSGALKFVRATKQVDDATKRTDKGVEKMDKSFINAKAGMLLAGAAAVGLAVKLGKDLAGAAFRLSKEMITLAGNAQEVKSKFNAVFKEEAATSLAFFQDLGEGVGRGVVSLQEYGAGLQDILVPMGLQRDEAARLSEKMVQLSLDVASFNNVQDSQVIDNFKSALVGESESVKKYGIMVNEARIKQFAFNMGLSDGTRELTDLEKIQARVAILFSDTSDAQGDAIRTADSYNNQVKRMEAGVTDLKEEFGVGLVAALQGAIEEFGGVERVLNLVETALGTTAIAAELLIKELPVALGVVEQIIGNIEGFDAFLAVREFEVIKRRAGELGVESAELFQKKVAAQLRAGLRGIEDRGERALFVTRELAKFLDDVERRQNIFAGVDASAMDSLLRSMNKMGPIAAGLAETIIAGSKSIREEVAADAELEVRMAAQAAAALKERERITAKLNKTFKEQTDAVVDASAAYGRWLREQVRSGDLAIGQAMGLDDLNQAFAEQELATIAAAKAQEEDNKRKEEGARLTKILADANRDEADAKRAMAKADRDHAEELRGKVNAAWDDHARFINAAGTAAGGFADAVGDAALGTGEFGAQVTQTMQQVIKDMIAATVRAFVLKQVMRPFAGALGIDAETFNSVFGITEGARGMVYGGGDVQAFASGGTFGGGGPEGLVTSPTTFGIGPGRFGLAGERGPEAAFREGGAIAPLIKTRDGKLGVTMEGGGGMTLHMTNVWQLGPGSDIESFRSNDRQIRRSLGDLAHDIFGT